jgi:hypothetical protein
MMWKEEVLAYLTLAEMSNILGGHLMLGMFGRFTV